MALICFSRLYDAGINIVAAVPPSKSEPTYNYFMDFVGQYSIPIISYENSMKDPAFIKKILDVNADIAVVCSYNRLFPSEFLNTAKDGFINVHPSLLPDYRGGNPYSHVIINGETETGVTLHFMDSTFDTGDIISQHKVPLDKTETMGTLFTRLNYLASDALITALRFYNEHSTLPRVPQPDGIFKKANAIDIKFGNNIIDWSKSAEELERFIRSLNPFISAFTRFRGDFFKIHTAHFEKKKTKYSPGTICCIKDKLGVACGEGILYLKILQAASYFIGDSKDFIRLYKPNIGEKFE